MTALGLLALPLAGCQSDSVVSAGSGGTSSSGPISTVGSSEVGTSAVASDSTNITGTMQPPTGIQSTPSMRWDRSYDGLTFQVFSSSGEVIAALGSNDRDPFAPALGTAAGPAASKLARIDPVDGTMIWTTDMPVVASESDVVVTDKYILVIGCDGSADGSAAKPQPVKAFLYDQNGKSRWTKQIGTDTILACDLGIDLKSVPGRAVVILNRQLIGLSLSDGEFWSYPLPPGGRLGMPGIDGVTGPNVGDSGKVQIVSGGNVSVLDGTSGKLDSDGPGSSTGVQMGRNLPLPHDQASQDEKTMTNLLPGITSNPLVYKLNAHSPGRIYGLVFSPTSDSFVAAFDEDLTSMLWAWNGSNGLALSVNGAVGDGYLMVSNKKGGLTMLTEGG